MGILISIPKSTLNNEFRFQLTPFGVNFRRTPIGALFSVDRFKIYLKTGSYRLPIHSTCALLIFFNILSLLNLKSKL